MRFKSSPILFLLSLITACQTMHSDFPIEEKLEVLDSVKSGIISEEAIDTSLNRRFCQDDIFSVYVQESYIDQINPRESKAGRNTRRIRLEANLEAYRRLNNQLPIFFGGMPVEATPRVYSWLQYFTGPGRSEFLRWMVRSESYKPLLLPLIEKEGLPSELYFLAMIESGFSNTAFSRSAATGTWQFMKPTAKHYGLQIDHWVDERRDPVKSTLAAAKYLKDLHRQLKDWYLAVAAYNAGPGKISRAIAATRSRNYWVISKTPHLLPETKNYIPKLLAALIISSHPENYGFNVSQDLRNATPLTTIPVNNSYRLSEIAAKLDISPTALQRWNPEISRGITPPPRTNDSQRYLLRLPKPLAERFSEIEEDLEPLFAKDVQLYKIRLGDTLEQIARSFHVDLKALRQLNQDADARHLKPGKILIVPTPIVEAHSRSVQTPL